MFSRTCPEFTSGAKDGWLVFFGQINQLCIAAAFEVEHAICAPAMLIVANQAPLWIGLKAWFFQFQKGRRKSPVFSPGCVC
jgi:hypothetical protein